MYLFSVSSHLDRNRNLKNKLIWVSQIYLTIKHGLCNILSLSLRGFSTFPKTPLKQRYKSFKRNKPQQLGGRWAGKRGDHQWEKRITFDNEHYFIDLVFSPIFDNCSWFELTVSFC